MDIRSQKDRLEQELRFLKESFEAEVITKEEFDKGKERIERKLNELDYVHGNDIENRVPLKEQKNEPDSEDDFKEQEEENREIYPNEEHDGGKDIPILVEPKKSKDDGNKKAKELDDEEHHTSEDKSAEQHQKPESQDKEKSHGFWKYTAIILIVLILGLGSFYFMGKIPPNQSAENKFVPKCYSDSECIMEGMLGTCSLPGTEKAKCSFVSLKKTKVTVLNDRNLCISCDTSRVLGILEQWFGELNVTEIKYETEYGKNLASKYNADMLPLYALESSIEDDDSFAQFKASFSKIEDEYVLSDRAAGATIYLGRKEIPMKLELFVKNGDVASAKAEQNVNEFLQAFKNAGFEKHLSNSELSKELGLNSFPVLLVNNKVKLSGVNSPEAIKQGYCRLNEDENCKKELSSGFR